MIMSSLVSSGIQGIGESGARLEGMSMTNIGGMPMAMPEISNLITRNPGLFKAIMLTSGGLTGGLSSTIAGGKFIDGFRQGLITSGLNHVAHLTSELFQQKDSYLAVLEDSEGASGFGHMALAGGNDKKGWSYLSKDGRLPDGDGPGNQDGTQVTGGKSARTYEPNKFSTLNDVLKAHPQYDLVATIRVTYKQVQTAFAVGLSNALENYHVLFNNCGHTINAALNAVKLYGGSSIGLNHRFQEIQRFLQTGSYYQSTRAFAP